MRCKILNTIGDAFVPEAKAILEKVGSVQYAIPKQVELGTAIADVDAVLIGLGLVFDKKVLSSAKKLKVIATATTGLDHIDVEYAKSVGIEVLSLKDETIFLDTITGTAELAMGLLISLSRSIPTATASVNKMQWDREQFKGNTLYGKTLGIVGLGRLGKMMARYGQAFGMKVIFTDPLVEGQTFPLYTKCSFEELLKNSDVISIHTHLAPDTTNLIDARACSLMKPNAVVINTARGKIVDELAIFDALKAGRIAGYGADVLADELQFKDGISKDNPLVTYAQTHHNVLITPHIGGMTHESRRDTDVFMALKLAEYLKKEGKKLA